MGFVIIMPLLGFLFPDSIFKYYFKTCNKFLLYYKMLLRAAQIWRSLVSDPDIAIVLVELIQVALNRLLADTPKEAPSGGRFASGFDQDIVGCVVAHRSRNAAKEQQADVIRNADGEVGHLESADWNYVAPVIGRMKYVSV